MGNRASKASKQSLAQIEDKVDLLLDFFEGDVRNATMIMALKINRGPPLSPQDQLALRKLQSSRIFKRLAEREPWYREHYDTCVQEHRGHVMATCPPYKP